MRRSTALLTLALVIARSGPRISALLRVIVTVPLVLPPMVGGVALLFLFGRTGPLGQVLASWGIQIPFSTTAVIIAKYAMSPGTRNSVLRSSGLYQIRGSVLTRGPTGDASRACTSYRVESAPTRPTA